MTIVTSPSHNQWHQVDWHTMISQKDITENNLSREDIIKIIVQDWGRSEEEAKLICAIAIEEVGEDIIIVLDKVIHL